MREIPKKIVVAGREISIVWKDFDETWGQYLHDEREIQLAKRMRKDPKAVWQTLLHEALHACIGMAGLDHILGGENEEAVVRCIEHMFFPVMDKVRPPVGFTNASKKESKEQEQA